MMGGGPKKDKKFVQKIISQIKKGCKELFVVNDRLGTPTYTHDFAKNLKIVNRKKTMGPYLIWFAQGLHLELMLQEKYVKI